MTWLNNDGLFQKFGKEEGVSGKGGEYTTYGPHRVLEVGINYTDVQSTSAVILGAVTDSASGGLGLNGYELPNGARIEAVEVVAETAFTSSGTIGTSTFVLGLVDQDRSTAYDDDGLLSASFTGGSIDAAGERTYVTPGVTGAGALVGTTLTNTGLLVVKNTQHASHPFTAGKAKVRIFWYNPTTVG